MAMIMRYLGVTEKRLSQDLVVWKIIFHNTMTIWAYTLYYLYSDKPTKCKNYLKWIITNKQSGYHEMKKAMAFLCIHNFSSHVSRWSSLIMFSTCDHTQAHAVWSQHLDLERRRSAGWEEAKKLLLPGVGLASFRDHERESCGICWQIGV